MSTQAGEPLEPFTGYREALEKQRQASEILLQRWVLAKQTIWLALLTAAFLIFYLIDIMQQSMVLLMARY